MLLNGLIELLENDSKNKLMIIGNDFVIIIVVEYGGEHEKKQG